jgi:hypothetical protein
VALLRGEVRVTAVMGRERRRPERVDGGGVYEPWGPWERVLTDMVVILVVVFKT